MKIASAQLRDFATRYTAAWCSSDPARVAAFFALDGSLKVNDTAPAVGRDAISDVAHGFMTAFPDMQLFLDDVVMQTDCTEFHWTLTGTNTGPGGKGHQVRISGFEIWQLDPDGLILKSQGHFDETAYQHQLQHGLPASGPK